MPKDTRLETGLKSEKLVAEHFKGLGYELILHRSKVFHTEIDLIFKDQKGVLHFVEVKSRKATMDWHYAISNQQKMRLERALEYALRQNIKGVRCHLAIFGPAYGIKIFWDILSKVV